MAWIGLIINVLLPIAGGILLVTVFRDISLEGEQHMMFWWAVASVILALPTILIAVNELLARLNWVFAMVLPLVLITLAGLAGIYWLLSSLAGSMEEKSGIVSNVFLTISIAAMWVCGALLLLMRQYNYLSVDVTTEEGTQRVMMGPLGVILAIFLLVSPVIIIALGQKFLHLLPWYG